MQAEFVGACFGDLVTLCVGQIGTVEERFVIESETLLQEVYFASVLW